MNIEKFINNHITDNVISEDALRYISVKNDNVKFIINDEMSGFYIYTTYWNEEMRCHYNEFFTKEQVEYICELLKKFNINYSVEE